MLQTEINWRELWEKKDLRWDHEDRWINDLGSSPCVGDFYWTVDEIIERTQAWLDAPLDPREQYIFLPDHDTTRRTVLPVYQALLHETVTTFLAGYQEYARRHWRGKYEIWSSREYKNYEVWPSQARFVLTVPFETVNKLFYKYENGPSRHLWEQAPRVPRSKFRPIPRTSATKQETPDTTTISLLLLILHRKGSCPAL
jgi:hypothetical protein